MYKQGHGTLCLSCLSSIHSLTLKFVCSFSGELSETDGHSVKGAIGKTRPSSVFVPRHVIYEDLWGGRQPHCLRGKAGGFRGSTLVTQSSTYVAFKEALGGCHGCSYILAQLAGCIYEHGAGHVGRRGALPVQYAAYPCNLERY